MRLKRRFPRGMAMTAVLFVVFAVLLFGLALGSLVSFQYELTQDSVHREQAFEAAQAGVAQAMENLSLQPTWGMNNESITQPLAAGGTSFTVSFNPSGTVPFS